MTTGAASCEAAIEKGRLVDPPYVLREGSGDAPSGLHPRREAQAPLGACARRRGAAQGTEMLRKASRAYPASPAASSARTVRSSCVWVSTSAAAIESGKALRA